ncbi:hypothetical protein Tco_0132477 [Tanacetum coccineum]
MAMRRAANAVDLMSLLPQLHDPQSELLLLRSCMEVLSLETYSGGLLLYPSVSVVWGCTRKKWILHMLLWPRGPNLGCYKTTSYVTVAMWCVGISTKKEAPVNFLTDSSDRISTLRPADVLVFGWVGGKHTCVDLTGVPPLVGLSGPLCCYRCSLESRVTARPSSSHEFPIAHVTAPPGIRRRSATLIRPGEAIPFGRPYRTHLNGPRKLLTTRKKVGPLPARRLASRHASPRSPDHHSSYSSSSSDSSPIHSLGLDAPDQAHSGSLTRDVSPRLCYPPRRAPRRSKAFRRWCAAPLSTLYPPTTSESSLRDSSERPMHLSILSAGPSCKRCRSPVDSVPSSTPLWILGS